MLEWNELASDGRQQRLRHDQIARQLSRRRRLRHDLFEVERAVKAALNTVPDVPEWYLLSTSTHNGQYFTTASSSSTVFIRATLCWRGCQQTYSLSIVLTATRQKLLKS